MSFLAHLNSNYGNQLFDLKTWNFYFNFPRLQLKNKSALDVDINSEA